MKAHKTRAEPDRHRVVCLACPWFHHDAALTAEQLRAWGRNHQRAAEER